MNHEAHHRSKTNFHLAMHSSDRVSIDAYLATLPSAAKSTHRAKYKIAFRVFDVDDDGEVSADDLFHVEESSARDHFGCPA